MSELPKTATVRWMSVDEAARILGVTIITLRRALERAARRKPDGCIEAAVDGLVARRFGRRWRVHLAPGWLAPLAVSASTKR